MQNPHSVSYLERELDGLRDALADTEWRLTKARITQVTLVSLLIDMIGVIETGSITEEVKIKLADLKKTLKLLNRGEISGRREFDNHG